MFSPCTHHLASPLTLRIVAALSCIRFQLCWRGRLATVGTGENWDSVIFTFFLTFFLHLFGQKWLRSEEQQKKYYVCFGIVCPLRNAQRSNSPRKRNYFATWFRQKKKKCFDWIFGFYWCKRAMWPTANARKGKYHVTRHRKCQLHCVLTARINWQNILKFKRVSVLAYSYRSGFFWSDTIPPTCGACKARHDEQMISPGPAEMGK